MRALALALALCASACQLDTSGLDAPAAQDAPGTTIAPPAALATVLAAYGAQALAQAPRVRWTAATPDCGGTAWRWTDGHCVRGVFQADDPDVITLATWPGALMPQTSFAHETLHWLLLRTTGDANQHHTGDFYARVDAANEALWRDE